MKEVALHEICDLLNGYAFKSNDYIDFSNTLNCRMSNIRPEGYFDIQYAKKYLPDNYVNKYSSFLLNDGDLVIAMTDMANDPKILGVPTIVKTNGYKLLLNQRVGKLIILDKEKVHIPYLQYSLNRKSVKKYYTQFAGGGLQLNVGKKEILSVKIPLPPLATQQKIAAILDAADELRQKDKALVAKYDELTQALFLDMFGDPVTNPKGWVTELLGNLCGVGSGKRVFSDELVESGIPFYRGTEIGYLSNNNEIKPSLFITKEHYEELKKHTGVPQIGDLLMPSICPDGRIFRVLNNNPFYFKDGRVLWLRINSLKINSFYLTKLLKSIFSTNYSNIASGTTFAELKIVSLKKIVILSPPIKLQNQFAERVKAIEEQKSIAQESALKSEELFNSLLQKAFNGELV